MSKDVDASLFLHVVRPALEDGDAGELARLVLARWRPTQIADLLRHEQADVRRVAAVVMGLVGQPSHCPAMVRLLRDSDQQVAMMAEHGLWSIWFRSGSRESSQPFSQGLRLLEQDRYEDAAEKFQQACELDPGFAEAINQNAIAHYLMNHWEMALELYCRAISLNPMHFGALAGMGHCYAELDELELALRCYKRAVKLYPTMAGVARTIDRLEEKLAQPQPHVKAKSLANSGKRRSSGRLR